LILKVRVYIRRKSWAKIVTAGHSQGDIVSAESVMDLEVEKSLINCDRQVQDAGVSDSADPYCSRRKNSVVQIHTSISTASRLEIVQIKVGGSHL